MCLLPDKPSIKPTGDQLKSMETLAETCAVDLQCSCYVAVAELHLWYRQLAAADNQPVVL